MLPCACSSLAGARDAQVASTCHHLAVREQEHRHRRHSTSLQVCRAAKPHPSRLCQSIQPSDRSMRSHHHRKTPTTRTSSLLMGPSILEQLATASGARFHPPPTSVPPRSHIDVRLAWVRPPTARVSWQERSSRDPPDHQSTQGDHLTNFSVLRMPRAVVRTSAPLAPSVGCRMCVRVR